MSTPITSIPPRLQAQLITSERLMFNVNLFIYAVIAIVAFCRLPHLIGLFGTPSEWYKGHFLHYSEPKGSRATVTRNDSSRTIVARSNSTKTVGRHNSTKSVAIGRSNSTGSQVKRHNSTKSAVTLGRNNSTRTMVDTEDWDHYRRCEKGRMERVDIKFPPHFPVVPSFLRWAVSASRFRVVDGYSVGQLVLLSSYFYALIYGTFWRSNPFLDATRPAWVCITQMPLMFALAQKNNILGSILGYGYEKLNFIHRFAGRLVILAANLHSVFYFYKWTMDGSWSEAIARPKNAWGMVALVVMDVAFVFSSKFWRQKSYNTFIWSHTICMIVLLPATWAHQPKLLPYVLACVFLYAGDRLMRILKTRVATANIVSLPGMNLTHIEIPTLNAGWRAGQHVRLRVLHRGMGWFGWTETHPFTIASASDSHDGLILMCKQAGDWTKHLGALAKDKGYHTEGNNTVKVWIEGPYGGPGRMMFASFSAAVLVVGGSGITFGLSMLQDLVEKDLKGESRVKYIELVWVCPDVAGVAPLVPVFTSLIQQSVYTPVRVSVYYTKAPTAALPFAIGVDTPSHFPIKISEGLTLTPGRPRVGKALDTALVRAVTLSGGQKDSQGITGVAVGVCGPPAIGDDVVKAVAALDHAKKEQVGGIEIHEETFGC